MSPSQSKGFSRITILEKANRGTGRRHVDERWVLVSSQPALPLRRREELDAEPHEDAWLVQAFSGTTTPISCVIPPAFFQIHNSGCLLPETVGAWGTRGEGSVQGEPGRASHFAPESMPLIQKVSLPFRIHNHTQGSLRVRVKSDISGLLKGTCAEEGAQKRFFFLPYIGNDFILM